MGGRPAKGMGALDQPSGKSERIRQTRPQVACMVAGGGPLNGYTLAPTSPAQPHHKGECNPNAMRQYRQVADNSFSLCVTGYHQPFTLDFGGHPLNSSLELGTQVSPGIICARKELRVLC